MTNTTNWKQPHVSSRNHSLHSLNSSARRQPCKETTFKCHQKYADKLNYKLTKLQVEAQFKKAVALSAAAATETALEYVKKAAPKSIQKTIDKINNRLTQLQ
jgi:hypothetical protein